MLVFAGLFFTGFNHNVTTTMDMPMLFSLERHGVNSFSKEVHVYCDNSLTEEPASDKSFYAIVSSFMYYYLLTTCSKLLVYMLVFAGWFLQV